MKLRNSGWRVSKTSIVVATILTIGILVRVAAILSTRDQTLVAEWSVIVPNIVTGHGFGYWAVNQDQQIVAQYLPRPVQVLPSAYMPPVYAFLLAGLWEIAGSEARAVLAMEILQIMLSVTSCYLLYRMCVRLFNRLSAIIALLLSCVFPISVYAVGQISSTVTYCFVIQVVFSLLTSISIAKSPRMAMILSLCCGGAFGVLTLARAETPLWAIFVFGWTLLFGLGCRHRKTGKQSTIKSLWRQRTACAALMIIGMSVVVTPWAIRNWEAFGVEAPLTTSGGHNLWEGQNARATGVHGGSSLPIVSPDSSLAQQLDALRASPNYEVARDSLFETAAVSDMKSNPGRVAELAIKKIWAYWSGIYLGIPVDYPGVYSPLVIVPWLILVPVAIVGIFQTKSRWRTLGPWYLHLFASTMAVTVFFVMPRYNIIMLSTLIAFASVALGNSARVRSVVARHVWTSGTHRAGRRKRPSSFPWASLGFWKRPPT